MVLFYLFLQTDDFRLETLILMLDTAAILVVVIYSLRNEKRSPDSPEVGPFRLKPAPQPTPARAIVPVKRRRVREL